MIYYIYLIYNIHIHIIFAPLGPCSGAQLKTIVKEELKSQGTLKILRRDDDFFGDWKDPESITYWYPVSNTYDFQQGKTSNCPPPEQLPHFFITVATQLARTWGVDRQGHWKARTAGAIWFLFNWLVWSSGNAHLMCLFDCGNSWKYAWIMNSAEDLFMGHEVDGKSAQKSTVVQLHH